jgi:GxxExxY protein
MPIKCSVMIESISENDFYLLDHKVMETVFSIHKDIGRFYDEKIYQNELAHRCQEMGFDTVATEVPIQVSFRDFIKLYYLDLLINNRVMYELKAVNAITGEHRKQALNYLLLLGMRYGKLINMRPESVQHSFVSTRLTSKKRFEYTVDDRLWNDLDEDSIWLKELLVRLLSEWGAFLDTNLYYDAVYHFRGGEEDVVKRIEVINDKRVLGAQRAHILNSEIGFKITAITKGDSFYEQHLRKFLNHTRLRAIQWINFKHDKIVFKTVLK